MRLTFAVPAAACPREALLFALCPGASSFARCLLGQNGSSRRRVLPDVLVVHPFFGLLSSYRPQVGIKMGPSGPYKAFMFQLHYTNPKRISGYVDHSTLEVFYTPTLRQYDIGTLWTGPFAIPQPIPPGRPAHFDNTLCYLTFAPNVTFTAIQNTFHAHLLARGPASQRKAQRRKQHALRRCFWGAVYR